LNGAMKRRKNSVSYDIVPHHSQSTLSTQKFEVTVTQLVTLFSQVNPESSKPDNHRTGLLRNVRSPLLV
jgi:hypothetical protein